MSEEESGENRKLQESKDRIERRKEWLSKQENSQLEQIKLCPFCAEEIKTAAIVCKHCRRELPGYGEAERGIVKNDSQLTEEEKSQQDQAPLLKQKRTYRPKPLKKKITYKILSKDYALSDRVFNQMYSAIINILYQYMLVDPYIPFGYGMIKPRKYRKEYKYFVLNSWQEGGKTPLGAIKWLKENKPKSGFILGSSLEKTEAYKRTLSLYYRVVPSEVKEQFNYYLEVFCDESRSDNIERLIFYDSMKNYIIEEANKYTVKVEFDRDELDDLVIMITEKFSMESEDFKDKIFSSIMGLDDYIEREIKADNRFHLNKEWLNLSIARVKKNLRDADHRVG